MTLATSLPVVIGMYRVGKLKASPNGVAFLFLKQNDYFCFIKR